MNQIAEYRSLLDYYEQGLYTWAEVGGQALRLLFLSDDRSAFWDALSPKHREPMAQLLTEFDESAEPIAIKADPIQIWREMADLQRWFAAR